jgi:hypothetical protein
VNRWFLGFVFIENLKTLRPEYMKSCCWRRAYILAVEAPVIPDESDVLDGGDGVEGLGLLDWV